jgi:hypothetical protein
MLRIDKETGANYSTRMEQVFPSGQSCVFTNLTLVAEMTSSDGPCEGELGFADDDRSTISLF